MSIVDYLYKGAPPGAQQAAQQAAKNTSYGTIAKNIFNEGAFGFGKNLKGFDPNYTGKGALQANTAFQKYVKNPLSYIKGGLTSVFGGNAPGNIGGGTPAQRIAYEKLASSPFSRFAGPVVRSAFSLPMTAAVSGPYALYQMNKPSTPAGYDYVKEYDKGSITSAADAENALDYENFITGMMEADKSGVTGAKMNLEEEEVFNPTKYLASEDIARRNIGVPQDNRFTGIMRNVAKFPMFQGGVQAGLTAGNIFGISNPLIALAGGLASQFLPMGRSKPNMDYQYINDPANMGGLSVVNNKIQDPSGILQGKNFESAFGSKNLGEMYDKALDKNTGYLESLGGVGELTDEELAALGLTTKQMNRRTSLLNKRQTIKNRKEDYLYSGDVIPGTNKTRNQFAEEYNKAQENIGSNYDQLDTQSYTGSKASGGLGGGVQADGSYVDAYDPGTDD